MSSYADEVNDWLRAMHGSGCRWDTTTPLSPPQPCEVCGETVVLVRRKRDGNIAWCTFTDPFYDENDKYVIGTQVHKSARRWSVDLAAMVEAVPHA